MSVLPTEFFSAANPSLKDLETDFFDLATEKSVAKSRESCSGYFKEYTTIKFIILYKTILLYDIYLKA